MANANFSVRAVLEGLRRSLRDLILVVLGVLLALAADSWLDGRQDARVERVMLRAMSASLADDLDGFERSMSDLREAGQAIGLLREQLQRPDDYTPQIDSLLGRAYQTGYITSPNYGPYEAIKAYGLQIIQDDSLMQEIINVYETAYVSVEIVNDFNVDAVLVAMRPYFLTHFADLQFGRSATPLDYSTLARDPEFDNILAYRYNSIYQTVLSPYEEAAVGARSLLEAVERNIGPGE